MSRELVFTFMVEAGLVFLTSLLLVQPAAFFRSSSEKFQRFATISGFFLLSITFCWSVFLGSIIAIHQLTLRI